MNLILSLWLVGQVPLPLTLDSCMALARQNTYARVAHLAAEAQAGVVKSTRASLWPTLNAQAGYVYNSYVQSFTQRVIIGFDPATGRPLFRDFPIEFGQHHSYQVSFNLSYPLFSWGRLRNLVHAQEFAWQAEKVKARQTRETLAFTAGQLYLSLATLRAGVDITREVVQNLREHAALVHERYEAGLATHLEDLQARVKLQNAEAQLQSVQSAYASLQDQLREFLDLPDSVVPVPTDTLARPQLPPLEHYLRQVQNRLDLQLLTLQRRQTDELYQAADNSNKPSLVLQASYLIRKPQGFEGTWGSNYTLTLGFQMPIFDGFQREGNLQQLGALRHTQELLLRKRLSEAEAEVRRLYREAQVEQENYQAQVQNLALAREALETAREQYEQGLISQLEYLEVQNTYAQARYAVLQALSSFHQKKLLLEQAARIGSGTQNTPTNPTAGSPQQGGMTP